MDLEQFADPWEHVRWLSDRRRHEAYVEMLRRRAPGSRVLEVGTGTGVLACIAARLGARRVLAVEPTATAELARALVRDNGLGEVVEVVEAAIEELDPEPVDLAFAELLNADPFREGVVEAMHAAARFTEAGAGRLAPRALRVWAAPAEAEQSAAEAAAARSELERLGAAHDLELGALEPIVRPREPYVYLAPDVRRMGPAALLWEVPLGEAEEPPAPVRAALRAEPRGGLQSDARSEESAKSVAAVAVWVEAELDDGIALSNEPGAAGHFGVLLSSWAEPVRLGADEALTVEASVDDEGGVCVAPVSGTP